MVSTAHKFTLLARFSCVLACLAVAVSSFGQTSPPALTANAIRKLSREQAAKAGRVTLIGVVMWRAQPYQYGMVMHDGTAGIYVSLNEKGFTTIAIPPGSQVTVDGEITPGGFAPMLIADSVKVIGKGEVPAAKRIELQEAQMGQEDSQRLSIQGVVQSASFQSDTGPGLTLRLGTVSGPFLGHAGRGKWTKPEDLVDRTVVVTGVCLPRYNARAEVQWILISSEREEDLEVLDGPRLSPFMGPATPLKSLRPFRAEDSGLHRIHSFGAVTFLSDRNWMMLQDGQRAVKVSLPSGVVVKAELGERVRVAGFVTRRTWLAEIEDAVIERSGAIEPPVPLKLTPEEIFANGGKSVNPPDAQDYEGLLVKLRATLLNVSRAGGETRLNFQAGKRQFAAILGYELANEPYAVGSSMDVSGVLSLVVVPYWLGGKSDKPESFSLLLRNADDLRVVTPAPWWNQQRLTWAAVALGISALLLLVWSQTLQRTVRKQSKRIENDLRFYLEAESSHKATVKERMRLAADLHDGLQQMLFSTDYRLQAAEMAADVSEPVGQLIQGSRQCLKHALAEFRNVLWSLNEMATEVQSFTRLLEQTAQMMEHWPESAVLIVQSGDERKVPPRVAGSLMLLFQEAVSNALLHGQATKVAVRVGFEPEGLSLRIQDDGKGFDNRAMDLKAAEGHYGLSGMKQRMAWLGGKLIVESALGKGTCVIATVPWSAMQSDDAVADSPSGEGLLVMNPKAEKE